MFNFIQWPPPASPPVRDSTRIPSIGVSPLLPPSPPLSPPPATLSGLNCQKLKLKNPADTELRPGEIWKISFDAASR